MVTTLLDTRIEQETASGRFFDVSSPAGFYSFSQNFWIVNGDVLPTDFGYLLRAGTSHTGKFWDLNLPYKEKTWDSTLLLSFDARHHQTDEFTWQLTKVQEYDERFVTTVRARPVGWLARLSMYATNGSVARTGYATQPHLEGIAEEIRLLAEDDLVKGNIKKLRAHRRSVQQELTRFVVSGLSSVGRNRYEKSLKEREKAIDSIGFLALEPQYLTA